MKSLLKSKPFIITAVGILIVLAVVIIVLLVPGGEKGYRSISVSDIYGNVTVQNGDNIYSAYKNMSIGNGYVMTTDKDSYTRFVLDGDKYAKLEQESCARFEELGDNKQRNTVIRLEKGTLTSEITAPLTEEESFVINTPNAVLAVRGTFLKIQVYRNESGEYYTDVYTYAGSVACKRIMPDNSVVEEEVVIGSGYKSRIKMDEVITVYIEEKIEEEKDNVDPFGIEEINDKELVDIYNAAINGHKMFMESIRLWEEIKNRDIDVSKHKSPYNDKPVIPFDKLSPETTTTTTSQASPETTTSQTTTETTTATTPQTPSETTTDTTPQTPPETPTTETPQEPDETTVDTTTQTPAETPDTTVPQEPSETTSDTTPPASPETTTTPDSTPEPEHTEHSTIKETTDPTCTEDGKTTVSCTVCGEVLEETILPATGHTEKTETTDPTCTEDGKTTVSCTVCGEVLEETILPATGHTEKTETTDPTCTEAGKTTVSCTVCGEVLEETVLPATGHTEKTETTDPTCTEDGKTTVSCTVCGEVLEETVLPATGHTEKTETTEPTCTEDGKTTLSCTVCGEVLEETILPAIGHTEVEETVEPKFAVAGSYLKYCSVCEETLESKTLDPLPALYTEDGDITITSTGYTQGDMTEETAFTGDYVISQRDSSTATDCSITVESGEHNISLDSIKTDVVGSHGFYVSADAVVNIKTTNHSSIDVKSEDSDTYHGLINYGTVNIKDSDIAIASDDGYSNGIDNSGSLNITNTTLTASAISAGINNRSSGVIKIRESALRLDGTSSPALANFGGSVSIFDSSSTCEGHYGIGNYNNGDITIDNTIINTSSWASHGIYNEGEIYVKTGEITTIADEKYSGIYSTANSSFEFYSGELIAQGATGIKVLGNFIVHSGSIVATGTLYDIYNSADFHIIGGSLKLTNNLLNGTITNGTDEVECIVFDLFPSEAERTFTNSDGTTYIYALTEDDVADDGKYYVWKPINKGVEINDVNFPDEVFRTYVSNNADVDSNGYLSDEEIAAVTSINVAGTASEDGGVTSLKGVEYFEKLETLNCGYNSQLTELDVGDNANLKTLNCNSTSLSALDTSNNTLLTNLDCSYTNIESLALNTNTALTTLNCSSTGISQLDVSDSPDLTYIECSYTGITELDISGCNDLTYLNCSSTNISSLDVSGNEALTTLSCNNTSLTALDVSNNTALETLNCSYTSITELDLSQNNSITTLACNNTDIVSIDVKDHSALTKLYVHNNAALTYLDCSGTGITELDVKGDDKLATLDCSNTGITQFSVSNSRNLKNLRVNNNPSLTKLSINALGSSELDLTGNTSLEQLSLSEFGVKELDLTDFTSLTTLYLGVFSSDKVDVSGLDKLETVDVSGMSTVDEIIVKDCAALTSLVCNNSTVTKLNIDGCTSLQTINIPVSDIREIDITNYTDLPTFDTSYMSADVTKLVITNCTALTSFDISTLSNVSVDVSELVFIDCEALKTVNCADSYIGKLTVNNCNNLESVNIQNATYLTLLDLSNTSISTFDISSNTALKYLDCSNTEITELDISNNPELLTLSCGQTALTELDVSNNLKLDHLNCESTNITNLDISNNTALVELSCNFSALAFIGISNCTNMSDFSAEGNKYVIPSNTTTFDATTITGFDPSKVSDVVNADFDASTGIFSNITGDVTYTYDCGQGYSETFTLTRTGEAIEGVAIDSTNFPDDVFRAYVSDNFDNDRNYFLSDLEIAKVHTIGVAGNSTADRGITTLQGIENFTSLLTLNCSYNSGLTEIDVSKNTALGQLTCEHLNISDIDLSANTALELFSCIDTDITELDLKNNTALKTLYCSSTPLTSLDVSNNTALTLLSCGNTDLAYLDVSNNTALTTFVCPDSGLAFMDISGNNSISTFEINNNKHIIPAGAITFDASELAGFDPSKVTDVTNADYDASTGIFSNITGDVTYTYDCGQGYSESFTLVRTGGVIDGVAIDSTNFPDDIFRTYVNDELDTDSNGYLSDKEIADVRVIDVANTSSLVTQLSSLEGIEIFYNLTSLDCGGHQNLSALDISQNTALTYLDCYKCGLAYVDVSGVTGSISLEATENYYVAPKDSTTFDTATITGFDPSKVSNVTNADFDAETGVFSNITGTVSYTYDCGQGYNETFRIRFTG